MSQIVMNSALVLPLLHFASEAWVTTRFASTGETFTTDWRGGAIWEMVLKGELGYCSLSPSQMGEHVLGEFPGYVWGYRAKNLLEPIQGPRPRLSEKKYTVIKLAEVKRPEPGEFLPAPVANAGWVKVGASSPGELAQGLSVRMGGIPLPEGMVVKIIKAKGVRGMQWGHEAPKIQQVWEVEGPRYSLPLWRAEKRRAGIALAEERGLPSAPKEVRLLLAAAAASCGTEPRKLIEWAQEQKATLTAEKQAKATKKGARGTGLSAGPEPLTRGELYRAVRWLARQVRACRLEKKAKERAAKMAARERQALIEAAERLLWSQVDSPSGFGTDKTRAAGQTQMGRVWTGNRKRERIHA